MRFAPVAAAVTTCAVLTVMGGCGNTYYQTRYHPDSLEEAQAHRLSRHDDPMMYEVPSQPPALVEPRPRVCGRPGEGFPPLAIVGVHKDPMGVDSIQPIPVGGYDRRPLEIESPTKPIVPRVYGMYDPLARGPLVPLGIDPVGRYDGRPVSRTGAVSTSFIPVVAGYRRDEVIWCNPAAEKR